MQYQDVRAGEQCHTYLLNLYLKKVPNAALEGDMFYLCPVFSVLSVPDAPWFYCTPVGRNILRCWQACVKKQVLSVIKRIIPYVLQQQWSYSMVGLLRKYIQGLTGHQSLEVLHRYERVSDEQKQEACRALMNEKILPVSDVLSTSTVSHYGSYHVSTTS